MILERLNAVSDTSRPAHEMTYGETEQLDSLKNQQLNLCERH
jgi:hypothetical protein